MDLKAVTLDQAIGVVAFALNVWGNLSLTKQSNHGHIIRLCSNACWLIYSPLVGAWALMLNHMVFAGINVLGFHRWKKIEKARMEYGNAKKEETDRQTRTQWQLSMRRLLSARRGRLRLAR